MATSTPARRPGHQLTQSRHLPLAGAVQRLVVRQLAGQIEGRSL